LKQRSRDVDLKKLALGILVKTDSFRYCCNYLRKLERSIRKEITSLGGNKQLETIIDAISVRNEAIYID
jgi:geranylgeranyl diphosphate synthase type 3